MRIALLWPLGRYQPDDVVDADPRLAEVLIREGFARRAGEPAPAPNPKAPTLAELRQLAAAEGISLPQARDRLAADRAAPTPACSPPNPPTQEAPPCA